jgi:hypothetical protein
MVNLALIPLVIPRSEKVEPKPPYVCLECSNHTYSNNMITDAMFGKVQQLFIT